MGTGRRCWCESWGEGRACSPTRRSPPSIFVVGDRKQSIYRFRDAEVAVLDEAGALHRRTPARRPAAPVHHQELPRGAGAARLRERRVRDRGRRARGHRRRDAFRYGETDRFPIGAGDETGHAEAAVGIVAAADRATAAAAVAEEVVRLLDGTKRARPQDRAAIGATGPGDIAILFRTRESHRAFERRSRRAACPTYVYKGLGFFEADEIKDLSALVALPRSTGIGLARGRLAAIAPRAPLRSGAAAPCAANSRGRSPRTSGRRLLAACRTGDDRQVLERLARVGAAVAAPGRRIPPAELRRPGVAPRRPTPSSWRGPRRAPGARERQEAPRAHPPHPESRLRDARPDRRRTWTGCRPATSRTRSSTRSTPSTS